MRVPVFGRGCAGGVSGLALGARLARAEPGEVVLVVVVELCTLASPHRPGIKSRRDFLGACSAMEQRRWCCAPDRPQGSCAVGAAAEHTWPRTLDIMGWMIDPVGFRVMLSRSLPRFVEQRMAAPVRRFIKSARLQAPQLICHPGGAKVLDAIEVGARIAERARCVTSARFCATTAICRRRRCCSFSSARLRRGLRGPVVLSALGPGFTANFLALEAFYG